MKSLNWVLCLLYAGSAFAEYPCPEPRDNAAGAFRLIENRGSGSLLQFLRTHVVSKTAKNAECQTMYAAAIVAKNKQARLDLDAIGYGPKNANESTYPGTSATYYGYALYAGDWETILEMRARGGTMAAYSDLGCSALMLAAQGNTSDVVTKLIQEGEDVDAKLESSRKPFFTIGVTPLMFAVQFNSLDVVMTLIRAGARVDSRDSAGMTSLMFAAARGHVEIIEFLVQEKANIHSVFNDGYTALTVAAVYDRIPALKKLIELGGDVNRSAPDKFTPLMMAAAGSKTKESIEILLQAGASKTAVHLGKTAYDYAVEYKRNQEVLDLLKP